MSLNPYTRDAIENWVGDVVHSDALRGVSAAAQEFAPELLTAFLVAACERRGIEPADVEQADLRAALLEHVARLELPASARAEAPELCARLLEALEAQGRLSDGRLLGAYVRALGGAFSEAASGKPKPARHAGSPIGRNDPCPCGSGRKYKKCCMGG